ncbi:hypothetical protein HYH03_004659 [Edaphochlamys debaryana]|uniref:Sulfotransferase n=1 Tax=Edaphochlamys debaryana TaxID=47281 RepID=A0A835Y720_9CHLO|nr:hypothetical protein HYH03_004659 [Edaphochlamys debaryana]|eukprot:KAG2497507.1 hypothetical protein HYH03_004659 [Edaphochlamys debaryana]
MDYFEELVGTPSKLALKTKKSGVLPQAKYSMDKFDILPFQNWLRDHGMMAAASGGRGGAQAVAQAAAEAPPPLSYICGVFVCPLYKFIFVRNRKTASSTFITAVKKFMAANGLCNATSAASASSSGAAATPGGAPSAGAGAGAGPGGGAEPLAPNPCVQRLDPDALRAAGRDPDAMWRDYTVITSSRNPWARAASGYEFTYSKWHRKDAGCQQPSFDQFCRDPFIMGKLSNLYQCVGHREGVGTRYEGHWNFDFCHVEPVHGCMVDGEGQLVVDFVIRYEHLLEDMAAAVELINERRDPGLPALALPEELKWRNKGAALQQAEAEAGVGAGASAAEAAADAQAESMQQAAYVYADKYRQCGGPCVNALADFYSADLELFGWERPGQVPGKRHRQKREA